MSNKNINLFLISCLLLVQLNFINSTLQNMNVEVAINCGGPEIKTKNGVVYKKDSYFKGGESSDFGVNSFIKNTKDMELYQTERWSTSDLEYSIPIKNQGKFVLVLKFSEVYFNNAGEKIFDVKIGDIVVLKDIDIFSKVGKQTAYDEFIQFEIKNDEILIDNKVILNGYDKVAKELKITFVKKEADNPKINAIIIVRGGLEQTDYKEYKKSFELLEKQKKEVDKKNREFQRMSKSIDFEDFEDDFVDDGKKYRVTNNFFSGQSICLTLVIIGAIYFLFSKKK